MMRAPGYRKALLGLMLAPVLLALLWQEPPSEDSTQASLAPAMMAGPQVRDPGVMPGPPLPAGKQPPMEPLSLADLRKSQGPDFAGDPFASRTWHVPPPRPKPVPPPKPLPPPPPSAPPLPFSYLGKWQEEGRLMIYLTRGERLYAVSPGDTIDNTYRVDGVTGTQLTFTYLPLHHTQYLYLGEAL